MKSPRIVIALGDPAGIVAEITYKALIDPSIRCLGEFIVIGDKTGNKIDNIKVPGVRFIDLGFIKNKVKFGQACAFYGKASANYLIRAHQMIKAGYADCLVTAPVNKAAINESGIKFSGQTEFLAGLSRVDKFLMLLVGPKIRVSLVTRHIPLNKVSLNLNVNNICETIKLTNFGLKKYFSVKDPQIAICGLNPHASDNGILGDEERFIIKPAIKKCKIKGVSGPYPADSLFYRKGFDAFVAMYHDQGLIPVKSFGMAKVVNMTIGLPFIRTSPGHGTAFEIAGKNIADPASMKEAIKLAVSSYKNSYVNS